MDKPPKTFRIPPQLQKIVWMGPKQLKITPQNQKSYKMQVIILFKQIPKNFSGPNPENTPLGPIRGQRLCPNIRVAGNPPPPPPQKVAIEFYYIVASI